MTTYSGTRLLTSQSTVFALFFRRVGLAHAAWRQRRALGRLDDAALRDMGITRRQAMTESQRPVWDVPQHWIK